MGPPLSQWVVQKRVDVFASKSSQAKVISHSYAHSIVLGSYEDGWLHLADKPGVIRVTSGGHPLVVPRHVSYEEINHRTCEAFGKYTIRSWAGCQAAADELLRPRTLVFRREQDEGLPEGCHIDNKTKTLSFSSGNHSIDKGALGQKTLICVSKPMTMSTTATTSSTTTSIKTTSITTLHDTSLLCFSVMRHDNPEEDLIKAQLTRGIGIFGCDDAIVICAVRVFLGRGRQGQDVWTWRNPANTVSLGDFKHPGTTTNSWLNTEIFINAFHTIVHDSRQRVWQHDWLIKADPDAVLFADRLRDHLRAHTGQAAYLVNCNRYGIKLFGSVEAFTKQAMDRYARFTKTCLALPWHGWGEDNYMQNCMNKLGVTVVADFGLVGDARCHYAPCSDRSRAVFHPFKDVAGYMKCWQEATAW